jgi:alkaline phosphatase
MRRFAALLAVTLTCCAAAPDRIRPATPVAEPKRIILIVGDGFGPAHLTFGKALTGSESNFRRFSTGGLMTTHAVGTMVTDSAASATAFATGVKTRNGMLSVDADGNRLETVLERAEKHGLSTGVVTTTAFYDATPAAFAAHVRSRDEGVEIVRQMLSAGLEVVFGGGAERFGVEGRPDLASTAAANGYTLITTREQLDKATGSRMLAAFRTEAQEQDSQIAPLPVLAAKAISVLSTDPEGFFLVIEHEGTDGASHQNATENLIASLRSLHTVIGQALDFASTDGQTLVILIGDHETGGMTLTAGEGAEGIVVNWSTRGHTGAAVPVLAYGPGSAEFSGLIDNTDIALKLFALME